MEYTLYKEKVPHGLKLSQIHFNANSFMVVDSDDYYDDDSEWEEYYNVEEKDYKNILENVKEQFVPYTITSSDDEISEIYNSIENENLKLIFLYILSIKNQYNNQKRGEQLIQILCGETVEYKKQIYSKGA
jgi:hypothetical protein